jgi:hypothetical protein
MIRLSTPFRLSQSLIHQRMSFVLCCVSLIWMTACVKESTYQAVQMEIAEHRRALTAAKDDVNQLTAEAARLQEAKQDQERNVIELLEALQKEKDAEALWQKQVRTKTDALVARLNVMQSQQRWLARETEHAVKEQATLEELVAKYKGQLQNSVLSPEPVVSPAPRDVGPTVSQPSAVPPPIPTPPPAVSPTPPPPQPEPMPPPVHQKPTPEPQDESWLSTFKGWLGSLWRMIFS